MQSILILITTVLAAVSIASPTPVLEKRYTKTRLTEFSDSTCQTEIYESKGWGVSCVTIDGAANGFNFALGSGPKGHSQAIAFSESGCSGDSELGVIPQTGGVNPDKGDCVDANAYMVNEPNFYGHRINSVKFV